MSSAVWPPSLLTIVQVTVAVTVTRSPAVSVVPVAGVNELRSIHSEDGAVGESAPPHAASSTIGSASKQRKTIGDLHPKIEAGTPAAPLHCRCQPAHTRNQGRTASSAQFCALL